MICEQISISINLPIIQNYLAVSAYQLLCAVCSLLFGHGMFLLLDRKSSKLTKPFFSRSCTNTLLCIFAVASHMYDNRMQIKGMMNAVEMVTRIVFA